MHAPGGAGSPRRLAGAGAEDVDVPPVDANRGCGPPFMRHARTALRLRQQARGDLDVAHRQPGPEFADRRMVLRSDQVARHTADHALNAAVQRTGG
jgi:hypothetical protein